MTLDLKHTDRAVIALAERKKISTDEAEQLLLQSQIILEANDCILSSYPLQVAFLSCYNAGNRIFKGGVICRIPDNIPNLLNFEEATFNDVLLDFFPRTEENTYNSRIPKILFGRNPSNGNEAEIVCSGWKGGINIYNSYMIKLNDLNTQLPIGACLASSYSLFWAFNQIFDIVDESIKESFGYSLWDNTPDYTWLSEKEDGPTEIKIPSKIWLVGLGHLGQAYLWILSNIKYKNEQNTTFLLQDYDKLGVENLGAQLLSFKPQIGKKKTRICAEFLEKMKLDSQIIEKKFVETDQNDSSLLEYDVLLTGLDNVESRREIIPTRFKVCLDGATNGKLLNFDSFTLRNLRYLTRSPYEIWGNSNPSNEILHENLYKIIEAKGGCGYLTNIGISTPFVGLFGASVLISEMMKEGNQGKKLASFSGKMRTVESYSSIKVLSK